MAEGLFDCNGIGLQQVTLKSGTTAPDTMYASSTTADAAYPSLDTTFRLRIITWFLLRSGALTPGLLLIAAFAGMSSGVSS